MLENGTRSMSSLEGALWPYPNDLVIFAHRSKSDS